MRILLAMTVTDPITYCLSTSLSFASPAKRWSEALPQCSPGRNAPLLLLFLYQTSLIECVHLQCVISMVTEVAVLTSFVLCIVIQTPVIRLTCKQ